MITPEVYKQLEIFKISKSDIDNQYKLLTTGTNYINLKSPATINNGIKSMSEKEAETYALYYISNSSNTRVQKFVPASGAATRMFKELSEFEKSGIETISIKILLESLNKLAFGTLIPTNLKHQDIAKYILTNLEYHSTPKGLIPFHKYKYFTRTPFEEHWLECIYYAVSSGKVQLHFTVSKEHQRAFEKIVKANKKEFLEENEVDLEIDFSNQLQSTDTIIIDYKKQILVDKNGKPVLRPGGHGALIQNLNSLKTDLVFIKNIDNVTHENHIKSTVLYKKALAGLLLELKNKIFKQLNSISNNSFQILELEDIGSEIMIQKPMDYSTWNINFKVNFWKEMFNRPIRVCGMVKNEGEHGGGPFWVNDKNGVSLQIVETAQIDNLNIVQTKILQTSTHFNPVDLVCYITDYKGNKFNLLDYVDESAAFITTKSVDGIEVNVLERPGLWNGAMANWISIFVEVPTDTFNPVKTVNDLLKSSHQA